MSIDLRAVVNLAAILGVLATAGFDVRTVQAADTADINTVLDDFQRAATKADFDSYFACLAPECIFLGTDATERWTADELRAFVKPYFDRGQGRARTVRERHVDLLPGTNAACFDELLDMDGLGECRGTGVVIKRDDGWRITQYSLSVPVPNEIIFDVVDRISEYQDSRDDPRANDDTAVRGALEEYLVSAAYPAPKPIDPGLFADDIEVLWSDGRTYQGREAVVKAVKESQRELAAGFEAFNARAEEVRIHRRGDLAWMTCRIKLRGTRTEDRGTFARAVRSSFLFEKRGDRWQMVHEHSDRVADENP